MSEKNLEFKDTVYHYGVSDDGVPISFEFEYLGESKIQGFQKSCGCVADVKVDGNKIFGKMTPNANNAKGKLYSPYNQTITVFFDDGEPVNIFGEDMLLGSNDKKSKVNLTISGQVRAK